MMNINIIAAPLIGAVIGLVTNGIAIRMLFRPFQPVKIGRFTLPFTPGLIPKEKPRIAKAIGQVIGANLLDTETLTKAMASEKLQMALEKKIDKEIDKLRTEEKTVREYLDSFGYANASDQAVAYIGKNLGEYVAQQLVETRTGEKIFDYAAESVIVNLNSMVAMLAESALEKSRPEIVAKMNEIILEECPGMLEGYMDKEYQTWMDKPMKELAIFLWQKKDTLKKKIWDVYTIILEKKSGSFLKKLDVASIVEDKINEFDMRELERLILEISGRELKALVWFGGILGMLLGLINLLM